MMRFVDRFVGKSWPTAMIPIVVAGFALAVALGIWQQRQVYRLSHDPATIEQLKNMAGLSQATPELETLKSYAQEGVTPARRALGEVLLSSQGRRREGIRWLQAAADSGDGLAAFDLGKAYFQGVGVARDFVAAQHWFAKASGDGGRAAYYLGLIYRNGYGVPVDQVLARQWFERAVGQGQTDAMFALANSWRFGEGGAKSETQALKYYLQSGELEHPVALQTLAMIYLNGELGEPRDETRFRHYMAEAEHALKHYLAP